MKKTLIIITTLLPMTFVKAQDPVASPPSSPVPNERVVGAIPFANPQAFFTADGLPDYTAFYRERYRYMAEHFFSQSNDTQITRLRDVQLGDALTAILWLSQHEDREKYLQRAHDLFGILLGYADGNTTVSRDCFGFYPVLKTALMLKEAGRFDEAWEPALRRFAEDGTNFLLERFPDGDSGNGGFDGNQGLARMYGCLLAKRLYPDMPAAIATSAKINDVFTRIVKQGDISVDSRNYYEVSFAFFILIARELGREEEIAKSPSLKRMFANIRDAITPNGFLPEFGSGYFSPNGYANTPIFLEYAAALYKDPTFAEAARRYFGMLVQSGPDRDTNISSAIHSCVHVMPQLLDDFEIWRGPLNEPNFVSGVTYRNARIGGERPAFLIMRPSISPGAPMIFMDLLGQGDHCQPEFNASIAYYESDHVPLFYQYGRYMSSASCGNQVIFGVPGDTEPAPEWKAGTWRTLSIPVDRLTRPDGRAIIERVSVRTADRGVGADAGLVFDNLRLSGPAGTKTVCDLTEGTWKGNTFSIVEGRQPGTHAIQIMQDGQGCSLRSFKPLEFDPKQYVELFCDVKWFGKKQPRQVEFRPTEDDRSWTPVSDKSLLAMLKDIRTEQRDGDSWARLEFAPYGTFDSSLVRQILLTKEGVLAVRDDIQPGASADGCPAFSLWQMYSIDSETKNRFTSFGECAYPSRVIGDTKRYRRGMSVFFSGPQGTEIGKQVIPNLRLGNYRDIQRDKDFRTAFARVSMQSGKPTYLNFLVVPHVPEVDLSKLDSTTQLENDADQSKFKTICDGVPVSIQIGSNGKWQVDREQKE